MPVFTGMTDFQFASGKAVLITTDMAAKRELPLHPFFPAVV
jgi:hypothetical protein